MSWVQVAEGYDAPAGQQVQLVYQIDVPWWLEWTPDEAMDWIMERMTGAWANLKQLLVKDVDLDRYEFEVVDPGNIYRVRLFGVAKGAFPWVAAAAFLGALASVLYLVLIGLVAVLVFTKGPELVGSVGGLVLVYLGYLILKEWKK